MFKYSATVGCGMKLETKVFWVLFTLSLLSAILILPYVLTLESSVLSETQLSLSVIVLFSILQSAVVFCIAVFFGNILSRKVGFGVPLIESWFTGRRIRYGRTALLSIVSGIIVGIVIFILDRYAFPVFPVLSAVQPPLWQGFLASFYGGIAEEVLMRFFLMSLVVFIIARVAGKKRPGPYAVWFSILFVAVIFGLGHLPITSAITQITGLVVVRAVVLNGIGGLLFGWLYWKKGLEAAIIAHFSADIVLHFLVPLIGLLAA